MLEAVAAPIIGFVIGLTTNSVMGFIAGTGVIAGSLIGIWIGATAFAPIRQRNEARQALTVQVSAKKIIEDAQALFFSALAIQLELMKVSYDVIADVGQQLQNRGTLAPEFLDSLEDSIGKQAFLRSLAVKQFFDKYDERLAATFLAPPSLKEIQALEQTGTAEPWRFAFSTLMDTGTKRLGEYIHSL